jgi:hypothetical protein
VRGRRQELRKHQYFMFPRWQGGSYGTPSTAGSRPGTLIAATFGLARTAAHPLHTRFTNIFDTRFTNRIGASVSEAAMRPDPRRPGRR